MTAHAPVAHIYLRLFEPRAFSFAAPMFGAPALLKLPQPLHAPYAKPVLCQRSWDGRKFSAMCGP